MSAPSSQTRTDFNATKALFTLDLAAPEELAIAAILDLLDFGAVASATAKLVTPISTLCSSIAGPAVSAHQAQLFVPLAVVGRLVDVDQVVVGQPL